MNYIQKLNDQIAKLDQQRAVAWDQLFELKGYLTSGKFNCGSELDGYVNVADVLNRLAQIDLNNHTLPGKTYRKIGD